ncbi:hypothetical protein [Mucilaginibacter sp.]|uniref:hypothetical protein n=1 Tax=Mucilaginibacter sp. TaxID=1882438 RepID=UPI0035677001
MQTARFRLAEPPRLPFVPVALIYLSALTEFFGFEPLHAEELAISITIGLISVAWFEFLKMANTQKKNRNLLDHASQIDNKT